MLTMMDLRVTHNFVADCEVRRLRLNVAEHSSLLKAVNSKAKSVQGMTSVNLQVGTQQNNNKSHNGSFG
jgi:hypothetical protein